LNPFKLGRAHVSSALQFPYMSHLPYPNRPRLHCWRAPGNRPDPPAFAARTAPCSSSMWCPPPARSPPKCSQSHPFLKPRSLPLLRLPHPISPSAKPRTRLLRFLFCISSTAGAGNHNCLTGVSMGDATNRPSRCDWPALDFFPDLWPPAHSSPSTGAPGPRRRH
jgi:hypothetical protein